VREVRADQQSAFRGNRPSFVDVMRDGVELSPEGFSEPSVAHLKARDHFLAQPSHLRFRDVQDPRHQQRRPRLAGKKRFLAGKEGLGEYAA
jgi:hypothetical protein